MRRKPKAIRDILGNDKLFAKLLVQSQRQQKLLKKLKRELPPPLDQHLLAALLDARRLVLYTDSSAWCSRLRYYSRDLRKRLSAQGTDLDKVHVRIIPTSTPPRKRTSAARRLSRANGQLIRQVADGITDHELGQALRRLSRHSG